MLSLTIFADNKGTFNIGPRNNYLTANRRESVKTKISHRRAQRYIGYKNLRYEISDFR